jgi:hypothetical protein
MSTEEHSLLSVEIENCQPLVSVDDVNNSDLNDRILRMTLGPNPASSSIDVQFARPLTADATLEVIDLHGRICAQQMVPAGSQAHVIDVANTLAPGMYTVRLIAITGSVASPLVIKQ